MSDKTIESYKWDKKHEILNGYKADLELVEATLPIQGTDYLFKTKNDYEAYREVVFNLSEDDSDTDTIQSYDGSMLTVTYSELKTIINAMYIEGKTLWNKKELLLSQLDSATSIDEVLLIVW